jgi:hypothetical protein
MDTAVQNRVGDHDANVPGSEKPLATLLTGIVDDVQDLVKLQLKLTRKEIEKDLRESLYASAFMGGGVVMLVLTALSLFFALAHLIHWLSVPHGVVADVARIPLWGCYGITGAAFAAIGIILLVIGKKKFDEVHVLDESAEALKENVEWLTTSKS